MHAPLYLIRPEIAADDAAIEDLHEIGFGPGRFARTAFRLREGVPHDPHLSLVALFGDRIGGSVRLTPIRIGKDPALLLGPLAVHPDYEGRGAGRALVRASLDEARRRGHRMVLLVGDQPYYGPLGFRHVPPTRVQLPGPVDTNRVLLAELVPGAYDTAEGLVRNWHWG